MRIQKFASRIVDFIKIFRIAVLVLGTAILFFACKKNDIEKIKAFSSPEELPSLEATNFQTLSTDSGTVRFLLKAKKVYRYDNDGKTYLEFPEGLLLIQYDENHNVTSSISADYAKEFLKEEKWEAKNNVVVTNEKGDTLKTEQLIWDRKNEKISTDEFVTIISADKILTGTGLTSDQNITNVEIKDLKGTVYIEDNKLPAGQNKNQGLATEHPAKIKEPDRGELKINKQ